MESDVCLGNGFGPGAPTGLIQKAPRNEMLDQRRVATQADEQRERLFTDRYGDLLAFAMHLTQRRRDVARRFSAGRFRPVCSWPYQTRRD